MLKYSKGVGHLTKKKVPRGRLVNRTAFANALRNDLHKAFDELHKETKIPKSLLLDEAIEGLLEKYKNKK